MSSTTPKKYFIIDFDSTFSKVEGLDELAKIALQGTSDQDAVVKQIRDLTDQGMSGEITFAEALSKRLELLHANQGHIDQLVSFLKDNISESFKRNKVFF
ncbi:MAG: D-3-phosphoglycerate dehydrogenase, partial [Arcticibacterium sp.]